jgi:DNA-binding GntR family transcriptional regulator
MKPAEARDSKGRSRRPVAGSRATRPAAPTARDRSAAKAAPAKPSSDGEQPIYLRIAGELKQAIVDGRYPLGSRLPTELELCEQFGVSRFTAREAVRLLSTAGLVTRRQRIGTVVIALPSDARYTHDVSSIPDLFQYAQDTELRLLFIGKVALTKAMAKDFGAQAGEEWIYALGLRHGDPAGGRSRAASLPICITRLFLNPALKGIEARLRERKTAVYALIERDYKLVIQRVEQDLQGVVLDADDAANLHREPGAPALRILRRYYSDKGTLLEVADNVHPSDRFTYRMELRR